MRGGDVIRDLPRALVRDLGADPDDHPDLVAALCQMPVGAFADLRGIVMRSFRFDDPDTAAEIGGRAGLSGDDAKAIDGFLADRA